MRHTTATILIAAREAINHEYPEHLYPTFTRTAETIKFLHGAAVGLRTFKRANESGIIEEIIAGIKRDGLKHLELRIKEAESLRNAVTGKLEHDA